MSKLLLFSLALIVFGLTNCASKEVSSTAPANKTIAVANSATETNSAKQTTIASTNDKTGVPECDEYIAKYEACIFSKVPEASRAVYQTPFDQMRKSWKDAAANPQAKAGLAVGCKQALETAKQSFAAYSCEW
jgi:hypothetical protein